MTQTYAGGEVVEWAGPEDSDNPASVTVVRTEGGWSAAKAPDKWIGGWRAAVSGRNGEYAGTWTADVDDTTPTQLASLFTKALQTIVSGTWRVNQLSGAWSIRTFK